MPFHSTSLDLGNRIQPPSVESICSAPELVTQHFDSLENSHVTITTLYSSVSIFLVVTLEYVVVDRQLILSQTALGQPGTWKWIIYVKKKKVHKRGECTIGMEGGNGKEDTNDSEE